ncbi:hypothetical protein [Lysinibacter cavernae]|uniref:Uncharacterized protein n=1 Tax=Lysinibacter cavernae TaxID=1640652 RepID=A0A7X5TTV7_9MICO|nr:hypothetical protein [Lysinibacter cavernae]NIH53934.1 hypothetical protein [Lysinibacter cavernae]
MMGTDTIDYLRDNARLEREVMVEHHARDGEDPAEFIADMPSVDELVVTALLADGMHASGVAAEHGMARLAGKSSIQDALEHRQNADRLERTMLHEIAMEHPELSTAVWAMLGRLDHN